MKWLVTILALLVGGLLIATLKLANVEHVDASAEALREMAELREALQRCNATKPKDDVVAPAPALAPTFENASRSNEKRSREGAKEQCMLEAARLGKTASLWCAGL
jgi:signal transduction histidine kinase